MTETREQALDALIAQHGGAALCEAQKSLIRNLCGRDPSRTVLVAPRRTGLSVVKKVFEEAQRAGLFK